MAAAFLFLVPLIPCIALRLSEPNMPSTLLPEPETCLAFSLHPGNSPGALPCPDTEGPASPLSKRAIRRAAKEWKWRRLEAPGWKLLETKRFDIRGDVPIDDLRAAGNCLEHFFISMHKEIGGDLADKRFPVRVFRDPTEFRIYAAISGAANAESFYDPRSGEVVIRLDPSRGRQGLQKTLAHEFTHQYLDRVWNKTGPLWLAEGMAEYFAGFEVRDGKVVPGAVIDEAVRLLREYEIRPLGMFLRLGRNEMYGPEFPLLYAQAWSFVHYLFTEKEEIIDLLLRGGRLEEPEKLEQGWEKHLERLKEKGSRERSPAHGRG
jgi:hypothetical protein